MTGCLERVNQAAVMLATSAGSLKERVAQAGDELFRDRPALEQLPESLRDLARDVEARIAALDRPESEPATVAKDILELAMRVRAHYTGAAEHFLNGYSEADAVYDDYDQLSGR
jgi:hypothetical protein